MKGPASTGSAGNTPRGKRNVFAPPLPTLIAAAAVMLCLTPYAPADDDWPQWRGPDRNGTVKAPGWKLEWPPTEVWRAVVHKGYSSPSVCDGRVYAVGWTNGEDIVSCLNANTGKELWTYSYACGMVEYNGPRATPTVTDGHVFTLSQEGGLSCLDAKSGRLLWNKTITAGRPRWGYSGSPLVTENAVILNAGGAGLAVSRKPPNEILWKTDGVAAYASPVYEQGSNNKRILMFSQSGVSSMDAATGRQVWWFPVQGGFNVPDPVSFPCNGRTFISNGHDEPCMMIESRSGASPECLWRNSRLQSEQSTPVFLNGFLYGFDDGYRLCCVEAAGGELRWSVKNLDIYEGSVIGVANRLIVLDADGVLMVAKADPSGFDTAGREPYRLSGGAHSKEWPASPAFAQGRLYCRSLDGTLVSLQMQAPGRKSKTRNIHDN